MPRASKKPADLSESIRHQLNMYALAASAAGVGTLALSQPAEGRIVYTPAHRHIVLNHPVSLDLNHDGVADFTISIGQSTYYKVSNMWLWARSAARGDQVAGFISSASGAQIAYALFYREQINSGLSFSGGFMAARSRQKGHRSGACFGYWNNATKRYLGLRFPIKGQTHYGWARLNESCDRKGKVGITALLTGYAYETVPNKAIAAGKTEGPNVVTIQSAGLDRLAQGSTGRWKR
jgi:hypothetical protein